MELRLREGRKSLSFQPMKFWSAIIAYLLIGGVLCWGLVSLMKGNPWIFVISFFGYIVAFGLIGCLPKKSHH
jgi:F0F1-type ATP synthase assembly protein I